MAPALTPARAAELAAREAYGRLVASLTGRTGDLAAAEDALSGAFVAALERWPQVGVPDHPEGWLLEVARRRHVDGVRHREVHQRALPSLERVTAALAEQVARGDRLEDRRLPLLFLCAHPSIDASIRAPLMLQTVLGLTAQQIGQAFLVSPTTMGQRLTRAKRKIRAARIPFETSAVVERERLAVVCEAIYGAFATGYNEEAPSLRHGLVDEAIWLGRLLWAASEAEPETAGLLALMLHVEARRPARRDAQGGYVPLDRQDPSRWDRAMIQEAEGLLWAAARRRELGRFQLEAAIQSAHAHRVITGRTDWVAVEALYRRLVELADTVGARVAHLAAVAEVHGAEAAYAELRQLPEDVVADHQAYWALRAHLERMSGRDARASTERAAVLSEDPAVRAFLRDAGRAHDG